ncbi:hypothetical protein AB0E77_30180 [Streptomyces sp. NPDC032940]|uniref:hypothetical protein n=1 Tax=Streptomyces sp. NPDC032940 TaxID=3155366 RepID=UPI0033D2654F
MLIAMAHRPYPAADKAWRQIMRRHRYNRPPHLPAPPAPQAPAGEYVLSTRRRR